jgi:Fur family ferric uptake transcriptional regulator
METQKLQRNTRQRQVILEELRRLCSHPTAAELHEIVRQRLPRISLGTIYRNLDLLAKQGLIRKLEISGSEKRFDGTVDEHYHVRCVECGKIDDLHDLPPGNGSGELTDLNGLDSLNGYEIIGHHLEFVGICPTCREKNRENV